MNFWFDKNLSFLIKYIKIYFKNNRQSAIASCSLFLQRFSSTKVLSVFQTMLHKALLFSLEILAVLKEDLAEHQRASIAMCLQKWSFNAFH